MQESGEYLYEHHHIVNAKTHNPPTLDLSITNLAAFQFIAAFLMILVFLKVGLSYKKNKLKAPKGLANIIEVFVHDLVQILVNVGETEARLLDKRIAILAVPPKNVVIGLAVDDPRKLDDETDGVGRSLGPMRNHPGSAIPVLTEDRLRPNRHVTRRVTLHDIRTKRLRRHIEMVRQRAPDLVVRRRGRDVQCFERKVVRPPVIPNVNVPPAKPAGNTSFHAALFMCSMSSPTM